MAYGKARILKHRLLERRIALFADRKRPESVPYELTPHT